MAKKNNIGRRPQGTPSTGRSGGTSAPILEGDETLVDLVEVRDQGATPSLLEPLPSP
jgi:hypothetical protein